MWWENEIKHVYNVILWMIWEVFDMIWYIQNMYISCWEWWIVWNEVINMRWGNACLLKCELYTLMWINWNMDIESELVMNWNVVVEMWVVYMNCEMLNCNWIWGEVRCGY